MINPIAYSYWRRIKAGARAFGATPPSIKADVLQVGKNEAAAGIISPEELKKLTGEVLQ